MWLTSIMVIYVLFPIFLDVFINIYFDMHQYLCYRNC